LEWQSKKLQMQGAQNLRREAYLQGTPQMDFLRSHQYLSAAKRTNGFPFKRINQAEVREFNCRLARNTEKEFT